MDLSNDLISKFVKITSNQSTNKTKEGTAYGTIVEFENKMYVKLDGSDLLTPINSTSDVKDGERVTIMIKDHNAVVTGNITSPSASSGDVKKVTQDVTALGGEIAEFETIVAKKVGVDELDAEVARINDLIAGRATIEDLNATNAEIVNLQAKDAEIVNLVAGKAEIGDLTATNAEIESLKAKDAEITSLVAGKANISDLTAINADIVDLKAKDIETDNLMADKASIGELNSVKADINDLQADKADIGALNAAIADIETLTSDLAIIDQAVINKANITDLNAANAQIAELQANKANVTDLNAANANINILDTEVADIQTLVNGNLTSDNIASLNLTSANTTIQNAMIKDAMIDSVTASKIKSGTIDTNLVTIQSTDGSMVLTGSVQQFKDENGVTRIQIGKDTGGNFTFILYDESGTGVLIDEDGIKSSNAIADGLIVDAKVADNANIAGSKLDIASVITEVNNDNSTTIKSNKIYLDEQGQSLEVAFNSLKTQVETIQDVTIDGDLTAVIEQVQSNTTQIEANKEGISTLVAENTIRKEEIQNLDGEIESVNNTLSSKYSSLEQDVSGFKTTVANTYTTKNEFNNLQIGGTNLLPNSGNFKDNYGLWVSNGSTITLETVIKYNGYNTIKIDNNSSEGIVYNDYITLRPNTTYTYSITAVGAGVVTGDNNFPLHMWVYPQDNPGTYHHEEILDCSHTGIGTSWGRSYIVFKTPDTDDVYLMKPFIFGTGHQIIYVANFKVEEGNRPTAWSPAPEDIQGQIDATNNNLANNYSTTSAMNSAINQKANEITSSVSETYATKQSVTDINNNLSTNYSTTSAMNSAIQQKANEITSSVSETYTTKSEFNNLEIGGTNTFRISRVGSETWDINYGSSVTANSENGFNVVTTNGKMHIRLFHTIKDNGYWTVRFKVKTSVFVGPIAIDICDKTTNNFSSDTNWTEITRTVLVDNYNVDPYNFVDIEQHVDCGQAIEYYFKDVKVEKGNRPTAWSPAPEDVQGQIDVTNNNLANNYSTTSVMNSAIEQKANEITSSVSETYTTKSEFNNLQIGGRNLAALSNIRSYAGGGLSDTNYYSVEGTKIIAKNQPLNSFLIGFKVYTDNTFEYVVSGYTDTSWVYLYFKCYDKNNTVIQDQAWHSKAVVDGKFILSFNNIPKDTYYFHIGIGDEYTANYFIDKLKIEKGNKATDYTPAPEDVQGQIDATNNNLVNNYSTTSAMNSAIEQKANEITSSVSETYATKQSVTDINNNLSTNYSTTSAMNSAIEQKANEIISSVSQTYISNYEAKKLADTTTTGLNKYLFERYQRDGFDYGARPTLNDLVGARLIESQLVDLPPVHTSDLGSNYIGVVTFYLYYDYACTKTVTITTDDHGTVYLNNVGIYELNSCQPADVTFNMIKGLNRIDIVYAEGGGGDGVTWGDVDGWTSFGAYANAVTNEIANRTNELTLAMTQGNMLNTDPTFRNGYNDINVYNNNGNGTVTNERIAAIEGCPNTSGYCLKITTNGEANPGLGGFYFATYCRYNAVYITKITAKIPVGYTIGWASNPIGDNGEQKWLSSTSGTGDWYDYYCKVKCGNSGDLSNTNFFYLYGPQASAENPVTWYVSYATVFDVTDSDERITNLANNLATNYSTTTQMNSAIDQKANEITSSVSQTYTTKSETTAVQNQITTSRNLLMGSRDYNLDKWRIEGANILDEWYNGTRIYTTTIAWANIDYWVSDLFDRGVIELSTPYTFSCYVMSTGSDYTPNIHFFADGLPNFSNALCGTATTSWQRISITLEWTSFDDRSYPIRFEATTDSPSSSHLKWACFQLERGRVATGWGPAPEDAQYAINDVNNNLANNYSTTVQMNSAIQQKANEITSSVSQAYVTKSEAATMNDTVTGNRKWLFEQYTNNQNVGSGNGTYPTLAHLANETLIASRLVDGLPGYLSELGNNYLGVYTVYLYYESAYTWNGYIISDDESTTYLNGVVVCQAPTCVSTTFTMNFKKGINKLQIIHGEGGGGDGVTLSDLGPWKEYGAYPACVTAASSNYYASNSDIAQTVNDLTIKFTESGGYNLLQNGHGVKGTSYWVDNGGGLGLSSGATGGATGNYFATGLPNGIRYYDWVFLLPNTHYVYQAKVWTDITFTGDGVIPLHYWFSYDASTTTGEGYTILDYQQSVSVTGIWTQLYLHFVTGNNNIYFKPFIYNSQVSTGTFFVTELMLSQSRVVQPWSPHPSEVYSGITQIDKDGITVRHSNFNGYTHMAPTGFYINHNGSDVVALDAAGLRVTGSITASSGHIGGTTTIDGNCLVAGTVGANAIAAGSITANKLCIGDTNNYCQLTKGVTLYSQYGSSVWSGSDTHCYWACSSDFLPFTMDGTKNPFKEGDRLLFDLDMYSEAYAGSRNFGVYFYSEDNSTGYLCSCGNNVEILAGWNNYKFEVVINDAWVKAAKTIAILTHIGGTYTEVRNVVIRRKVSGELIVDGSITATKISAGAITADKIAADAITGKTITGGSISGAYIYGNTIEGGNISGSNISGTTFTSTGTDANSSQYQTMTLNSGALMLTGAIVGGTNDGQEANRTYLTSMGLVVKDSSNNGFGGNANALYTNTGIYWNSKAAGGEEYPNWQQLIGYYDDYVLIDRLPLRMPKEIYTSGVATSYTNIYVGPAADGEAKVVAYDSSWGVANADMNFRPIRASAFYRKDGKQAYINATGGGTLTDANSTLVSNGMRTDLTDFYLGVAGRVRVTDKNGYNSGNGITYKPIMASAFENGSDLMFKKNIRTTDDLDVIDILNKVEVYRYDMIGGNENEIGLIAQACPSDLISGTPYDMDIQTANEITDEDRQSLVDPDNGGASVNLYHMASILWKVCKEQQKRIERLENSMKGEE